MKRVIGFALIFFALGMFLALILPDVFIKILIMIGLIIVGYNLFCC